VFDLCQVFVAVMHGLFVRGRLGQIALDDIAAIQACEGLLFLFIEVGGNRPLMVF
jgi:hypothetical protein